MQHGIVLQHDDVPLAQCFHTERNAVACVARKPCELADRPSLSTTEGCVQLIELEGTGKCQRRKSRRVGNQLNSFPSNSDSLSLEPFELRGIAFSEIEGDGVLIFSNFSSRPTTNH